MLDCCNILAYLRLMLVPLVDLHGSPLNIYVSSQIRYMRRSFLTLLQTISTETHAENPGR